VATESFVPSPAAYFMFRVVRRVICSRLTDKIGSRTYTVTLSSGLGVGEYGFLPPGAYASWNAASQGKLYSFRLIE
jgi:hypothetical protein